MAQTVTYNDVCVEVPIQWRSLVLATGETMIMIDSKLANVEVVTYYRYSLN